MTTPRLASPENRIYQSYWQDGSIELFAGLGAAAIGVAWLADLVPLGSVVPALLIPFWYAFRKHVVAPRLGEVSFSTRRERQIKRGQANLIWIGVGILTLAVVLFVLERNAPSGREILSHAIAGLPAALLGLSFALAALLLHLTRFLWHCAVFAVAALAAILTDTDPGWSLLFGGIASAAIGLTLVLKFVRSFPRLSNELD